MSDKQHIRSKYTKGKAARFYTLNKEKWEEAKKLIREICPELFTEPKKEKDEA